VNYPAHRAGHLKKLKSGGIASPHPRSAFIPVHRTGYSAVGFINFSLSLSSLGKYITGSLFRLMKKYLDKFMKNADIAIGGSV
jgi:hypothetical protein